MRALTITLCLLATPALADVAGCSMNDKYNGQIPSNLFGYLDVERSDHQPQQTSDPNNGVHRPQPTGRTARSPKYGDRGFVGRLKVLALLPGPTRKGRPVQHLRARGYAVWKRILRAVEELQRVEPEPSGKVH